MRKLAVLLLLAVSVLAEDDASALFYKGFWLEQAEGKLDEAAALYGKLLSEKPDAPEAPRALLGLIRIKVARNEDPSDLVAELERRYPAAKEEIAGAKRIAVREKFEPAHNPGDSPITDKLKSLCLDTGWSEPDHLFLVDLGSTAHPMLSLLLHASSAGPVVAAARVLVEQRAPEAYALLARVLLDDTALFRSAIVTALARCPDTPAIIVDALGKLYEQAAPRLRGEVVSTLVDLSRRGGEGRDRAWAILTRALSDEDKAVRLSAAQAIPDAAVPDPYLDAVLKQVEAGAVVLEPYNLPRDHSPWLLLYADRPAFRDRIERVLEGHKFDPLALPNPLPEAGALILARKIVRERNLGGSVDARLVASAAQASPRAAGMLLALALDLDDTGLVTGIIGWFGDRNLRKYLGEEEASKLRTKAIAMAQAKESNSPVDYVVGVVGMGADDFPSIVEGLRQRRDKGLPGLLLHYDRLQALGPAKAGALVEFCRDESQAADLLAAGSGFAKRDDAGIEFFAQVVPKAGPSAARFLGALAKSPALVPILADRLLAATAPEWKWDVVPAPGGMERSPGPSLWQQVEARSETPIRGLLEHVQDPRPPIAAAAARAACAETGDAGTAALRLALGSKVPLARAFAFQGLASRVPDGPAFVREFASRADLDGAERDAVARVLSQSPAYAPVAGELLRLGTWPDLWEVYRTLAPKECVDLALKEAVGEGDKDQRRRAIDVLVSVDDARRIDVLRKVLKGSDRDAVAEVLLAVRDQYLVELGEETLAQLRNPDAGIRQIASEAIDKLKFYAEAKKAFEK